ncbi:alpha/beta fold hydrolase [Streptomyces sp. NPDC007088]|uniref:alpha/beta fold hydrolase n=1 Tax=Streptomyces sp. NPDC007088 TaxID=3364773 RepID=UPI0036B7E6B2
MDVHASAAAPVPGQLKVPGATLYYEVRGSGPLLLLLPGGGGDAGVYDSFGARLAGSFTVVAFDPRGYSRSTLDGPRETLRVGTQADDALALIRQAGRERGGAADGPAYVLGGSSGAVVGLDLLARHPRHVARLLAHEPPVFQVLPGAAEHRAFVDEVYAVYKREGPGAAGARFGAGVGATGDDQHWEPAPGLAARLMGNFPHFLEYELREVTSYLPDVEALRPAARDGRLVLAAGTTSRGALSHRPAAQLAGELGLRPVLFPGGHGGWLAAEEESESLVRQLFA